MRGAKFTWFPKLTATAAKVPEEQRGALLWALALYGTTGEEPELEWPLDAIFESLKGDIENSKRAMESGAKGGRGNKKGASRDSEAPSCESESTLSDDGNHPSEESESTLSDSEKGASEDAEAIPNQTKPNQTKVRGARFKPPTLGEVEEYAKEYAQQKGLSPAGFDAERFIDYYTANGWKVGRNAMKDWKATVRDWVRRDCKPAEGGGRDAYSDL